MLAYSVPLIANSLSWWVLNSSDRVMITYYCSASDLGLYTAASKIPALLSVITTIFMQAWTVSSIKEYDNEKSKAFYSNVFKYFSLAMFIGGACVLLIVKDFMRIYVGPDYYDAWRYVPLLILGAVFYAFSAFFGAIYGAVKKNLNVTLTTIIAALINIGINYWLMSSNGIMAAALSTAVSYAVIGVFRMFDSKRYFSFDIDLIRFFISAVVLAVQTICVMKGIYIYIASLISVLLIGIINYKDIIGMVKFVKETVRNRRNRV